MTMESESVRDHVIYGRVTLDGAGRPAEGTRVVVVDAEHRSTTPLGVADTGPDGAFRVTYDGEGYRARFGRAPDAYLLVYDGERLLTTTRAALVRNAGPEQQIHVQVEEEGVSPRPGAAAVVAGRRIELGALDGLDRFAFLETARRVLSDDSDDAADARVAAASLMEELTLLSVPEFRVPGLSLTPQIRALEEIARARGWQDALLEVEAEIERRRDVVWRFHPCPPFLIRYTLTGRAAVSDKDENGSILLPGTQEVVGSMSTNSVPDYVERTCFWLQFALGVFTGPPANLRPPMEGNIIQVEVARHSPGITPNGTIRMHSNLSANELAWALSHELSHLVQRRYETHGLGPWHGMGEGCAVLAEEFVMDAVNRYIAEAGQVLKEDGTLARPSRSIIKMGYRQALFLKYFAEQHSGGPPGSSTPSPGLEFFRVLLESFDGAGYTTAALEQAVRTFPGYQRLFGFEYLDAARLDQVASETLLGNFWIACYLKDVESVQDHRFTFAENEEASLLHEFLTGEAPVTRLQGVVLDAACGLAPGETITVASGSGARVSAFGARFYRVDLDPGVGTVRVTFRAGAGFTQPLVQIIELEREKEGVGRRVRDILRSDQRTWSRTIASQRGGTSLDHILVIVAGTDGEGLFSLSVQAVDPAPDVMVTQWNRTPGTHYEVNPSNHSWTWTSPDLWVDNNKDGIADGGVVPGQDNRLYIRLRNQGSADASGIQIDFWYQAAAGILSGSAWQRVRNQLGVEQVVTAEKIEKQEEREFAVTWAPTPSPDVQHFSVRAVVTVPGDPNTDNKRCITSFACLAAQDGLAELTLVRRAFMHREDVRVVVIPRTAGGFSVNTSELLRVNSHPVTLAHERVDTLRLRRLPCATCDDGLKRHRLGLPDPLVHYPVHPETLPPGFRDRELVTVAHVVEGRLVGGYTCAIRDEK
jgi:hypothetical protein